MSIRCKVVCLFESERRFLLSVAFDRNKNQSLFLPIGGGIEFGERSRDAIRREIREELALDICNERLLSVSENIFEYNAITEHEMVFTYRADFVDKSAYQRELVATESCGKEIHLVWKSADSLRGHPTFPIDLLDNLAAWQFD